jgi:hypothetical protein
MTTITVTMIEATKIITNGMNTKIELGTLIGRKGGMR